MIVANGSPLMKSFTLYEQSMEEFVRNFTTINIYKIRLDIWYEEINHKCYSFAPRYRNMLTKVECVNKNELIKNS